MAVIVDINIYEEQKQKIVLEVLPIDERSEEIEQLAVQVRGMESSEFKIDDHSS